MPTTYRPDLVALQIGLDDIEKNIKKVRREIDDSHDYDEEMDWVSIRICLSNIGASAKHADMEAWRGTFKGGIR